jgi:hypothetical protein
MQPRLLALLALTAVTSGCKGTGDPNSGGLFWSEQKAQQRLDQQDQQLGALRAQQEQLKTDSEALETALERQNRILGR